MGTIHNNAEIGQIAKTVLMPGDPLRAKYVAEKYLTDPVLVNDVRNMFAFTGTYKGKELTVMGSGMGLGSIGIYSYELFKFYDVDNIIRIGSAGGFTEQVKINDIVLVDSSWSASTYAQMQSGCMDDVMYPSAVLVEQIEKTAEKLGTPVIKGRTAANDVFYREANVPNFKNFRDEHNCVCGEMESFALFHNANVLGKRAATLLTIADSMITHEKMSTAERQSAFDQMLTLALESCLEL